MTILEMHTAFNQGLQRVNANAYDYFTTDEINHWLNRAQERFIKDRAFITGDVKRVGFEGNQKRLDDIRTLVSQDYFDGWTANTAAQWEQVDLPADYLYLVNVRAAIRYDVCGNVTASSPQRNIPVRVVDNAEVYQMQQDPFAKSQFSTPLATVPEQTRYSMTSNSNSEC